MPKLSIVIPVYYNAENLPPLYADLKEKLLNREGAEFELVFVDDGSGDRSYEILQADRRSGRAGNAHPPVAEFRQRRGGAVRAGRTPRGIARWSRRRTCRNRRSSCGRCMKNGWPGMRSCWRCRNGREESRSQEMFANLYYSLTRRVALPNMPKTGFDVFLLDRKVIEVIAGMNETNTALSGLVLWSGFRTGTVRYIRRARKIGKSRWTLRKKIRLVTDTLFSFSTLPITHRSASLGFFSVLGSILWAIDALVSRITNKIDRRRLDDAFHLRPDGLRHHYGNAGAAGRLPVAYLRRRPPPPAVHRLGNVPPGGRRGTVGRVRAILLF